MVDKVIKYRVSNDVYTSRMEAVARSYDMGFEGQVHVTEGEGGQAYYLPGASREDYLAWYRGYYEDESPSVDYLDKILSIVVREIMSSVVEFEAKILKSDRDAKVIWGWAYVATVDGEPSYDHSGEYVSPETLVKATTQFMLKSRMAKVDHKGDKEGDIVGSLPVTKDLASALGIETNREGWIIGVVVSEETLDRVEKGELTSFSIGGRALKRAMT